MVDPGPKPKPDPSAGPRCKAAGGWRNRASGFLLGGEKSNALYNRFNFALRHVNGNR